MSAPINVTDNYNECVHAMYKGGKCHSEWMISSHSWLTTTSNFNYDHNIPKSDGHIHVLPGKASDTT